CPDCISSMCSFFFSLSRNLRALPSFPTRRSSDLAVNLWPLLGIAVVVAGFLLRANPVLVVVAACGTTGAAALMPLTQLLETLGRSEEHTSELQSLRHLVCRLLLEKKKHDEKDIHC